MLPWFTLSSKPGQPEAVNNLPAVASETQLMGLMNQCTITSGKSWLDLGVEKVCGCSETLSCFFLRVTGKKHLWNIQTTIKNLLCFYSLKQDVSILFYCMFLCRNTPTYGIIWQCCVNSMSVSSQRSSDYFDIKCKCRRVPVLLFLKSKMSDFSNWSD